MKNLHKIEIKQLPIGSLNNRSYKHLPIDLVNDLARELVKEYSNPDFYKWYCGVIYQFSPNKVHEWRVRAKDGDTPAKLFSKYVKDARQYKDKRVF